MAQSKKNLLKRVQRRCQKAGRAFAYTAYKVGRYRAARCLWTTALGYQRNHAEPSTPIISRSLQEWHLTRDIPTRDPIA